MIKPYVLIASNQNQDFHDQVDMVTAESFSPMTIC